MKFREIELKYDAKDIKLEEFKGALRELDLPVLHGQPLFH